MTIRLAAVPLVALSLTACASEAEFPEPPVNPAPKDLWIYEVEAESPVRPIQRAELVAGYNIVNRECLKREPFSGAPIVASTHEVPLAVESLGDSRFRARVQADLLLPSDLYGEGECRWQLSGVYSTLDDGAVRFHHPGAVAPLNADRARQALSYTAFEREVFDRPAASGTVLNSPLSSLVRDQPVGPIQPDTDFVGRFPLDRYVRVRSVGRPAN